MTEPGDDTPVRQLLAAAGLPASDDEIAALAAGYPALRAAVDALYTAPGVRYASPALHAHAADTTIADWTGRTE